VCPACGADAARSLGAKHGWPVLACRACGSIHVGGHASRRPELEVQYEGYHSGEEPVAPVVTASLERVVAACAPFRRLGRWLDLGFGQGELLAVAERSGWACFGTELARPALARAERRGWVVAAEAEGDARFPVGGFDVVSMLELIEHVPEPRRLLDAAARWLRPGGRLYLTTPNAASLNFRVLGLAWSVVVPPEHLTLWTRRGLRRALGEAGFGRARLRTEGLNPFEMLRRLRSTPPAGAPVHRDREAQRLATALGRSPLRRGLKWGVNQALSALGLGDTLKAWAVRA
jgi:SAM-dependent methyltransferase